MSIKRYLFLLIGGIVLGVAAIQLLLIALFKQHLNAEIVQKSRQLSTEIIEIALETIDSDDEHRVIQTIPSPAAMHHPPDNKVKELHVIRHQSDEENCIITRSKQNHDKSGDQVNSVIIKCTEQNAPQTAKTRVVGVPHHSVPDQTAAAHAGHHFTFTPAQVKQQHLIWKEKLHKVIAEKHQNAPDITFFAKGTPGLAFESRLLHHRNGPAGGQQSTAIADLTNYMVYLILASSVLALLLALWLSNHFTRPLQRLSRGFSALEQGDLGVQVEAVGINEYRKTINSFNQMSRRLAQLAQAEKMLQQQGHLAELGEVSRGLAHALRNPMHTIGLSVEQLKDPDLPGKLKLRLQDKIQAKIKHIDKTIKALLTLTSAEIQRNDEVPIRSVIQDIMLELRANDSNIKITLNAAKAKVSLKGAESEIRAIIHTLVVNAVEASSSEDKNQVNIHLNETPDSIIVTVSDQGKGIAPAVADKLFQPHVSSKAEGAGMGLYIANRLATLYYHGSITLNDNSDSITLNDKNGTENDPATGCTATVTFSKDGPKQASDEQNAHRKNSDKGSIHD